MVLVPPGTDIDLELAAFDGTPECVSFTANGPNGDVQSFVRATSSGGAGTEDIEEDEIDPASCTV